LERYRLNLREKTRSVLPGAHLLRRKGQSLEFRDYRPYVPGDDIRHVDWRISGRRTGRDKLLVKTFELETQARILISVDGRQSMRFPEVASKVQIALWVAEALAYIGGRSGDRVVLHRLFNAPSQRKLWTVQQASRARIWQNLRQLAAQAPLTALSLGGLETALPPGGIWILITDLYFEDDRDTERLAVRVRRAQEGLAWVILVDLDSWPYEKALVAGGLWRIDGPGAPQPLPHVHVNDAAIVEVEQRIEDRKRKFHQVADAGGYDLTRWEWHGRNLTAPAVFRSHFFHDPVIRRMLMRPE
jgi:hypothetical protein